MTGKLLEYLKPKISSLDNVEVSQIFQSLVLLPTQDASFIKSVELMTIRRLHSLHIDQLSQIIKAYSLLIQQGKLANGPSITFVQAFEAIYEGKCAQYGTENMGGLAQALSAFLRIHKVTKQGRDGAIVSGDILLTLVDQFLNELSIMAGDEEECTATLTQIVEVYCLSFFLRTSSEIQNSIDFQDMDNQIYNM